MVTMGLARASLQSGVDILSLVYDLSPTAPLGGPRSNSKNRLINSQLSHSLALKNKIEISFY